MRAVEETAARRCHGIWAYSEPQGDLFDDTVGESGTIWLPWNR
jgi:hypothetical protein